MKPYCFYGRRVLPPLALNYSIQFEEIYFHYFSFLKVMDKILKNYRPLLDSGKHADVTVDEIIQDIGLVFYIRRTDPGERQYIFDYSLRKHLSEKTKWAYEHSKIELQPLLQELLQYAFEIGKEVEEFAAGRLTREQIPLDDTPHSDLIIGLLTLLSRDTYLGNRVVDWNE